MAPARKAQQQIIVLTADDLKDLIALVQTGFEQINARLDNIENEASRKRIGSQNEAARRVATQALKAATTRPAVRV